MRTLWRVDQTIVESYYARALQGQLSDEPLPRLLEIADIISGGDGEAYAHQLKSILRAVEGEEPPNKRPVLQDAVEELLIRIHTGTYLAHVPFVWPSCLPSGDSSWRSGCIGVLFTTLVCQDAEAGPTLMVILTALMCEYLELSPISPVELLRGLATRLSSYSGTFRDFIICNN